MKDFFGGTKDCGVPMIMAHRGYSAKAPENTMPAFKMCMDEGFTAAELDVQMLADDPALCKTVTDQYSSDMMNMVQRVRSAFAFL